MAMACRSPNPAIGVMGRSPDVDIKSAPGAMIGAARAGIDARLARLIASILLGTRSASSG